MRCSFVYDNGLYYSSFPEISSSDRILIFAPHPDDESLGTGGIIQKALEKNASVQVVMMTNGDDMNTTSFKYFLKSINNSNYNGSIGDLRYNETLKATSALGLSKNNIIFLGYPDNGLKSMLETNWDNDHLFKRTTGSNQYNHSPYSFSYEKNAPYSGSNVVKNIVQIMNDYKPTIIIYPDDNDDHTDHFATGVFVKYAALQTGYNDQNYTYLVHKGSSWPSPLLYQPTLGICFPCEFSAFDAHWFNSSLSTSEVTIKEKAIRSHKSQYFLMKDILLSFVRTDEVFATYPVIDVDKVGGIISIGADIPTSSYNDTKNDALTAFLKEPGGLLQQSDDLNAAGISYDDKNVYLFSQSDDVQDYLTYNFHLRLFNGTDFKQLDITVMNGTVTYQGLAENSIKSEQPPSVKVANGTIFVTVPMEHFNGTHSMMMSTDMVNPQNNETLDYLAYRIFRFPENLEDTYSLRG